MEKFTTVSGVGVPLERSNVDTDQIIPAVHLKRVARTGFEDALFSAWRSDPNFVLNNPAYEHGTILVAGPDFGTGSSREHAVWALKDYGFRVVLAPSFADIFRGNAGKQGLLAGQISEGDCQQLWKLLRNEPGVMMTVSLGNRTVTCGSFTCTFDIDDYTAWRLREGLDDISLTLRNEDAIKAYEARRPSFKPRTLPVRTLPKETVVSARPSAEQEQ